MGGELVRHGIELGIGVFAIETARGDTPRCGECLSLDKAVECLLDLVWWGTVPDLDLLQVLLADEIDISHRCVLGAGQAPNNALEGPCDAAGEGGRDLGLLVGHAELG
jgi:hypothetical protein